MIKVLLMGRKMITSSILEYLDAHESYEVVGVLTDSHLQGSPTSYKANELGICTFGFNEALDAIRKGALSFDLGLSVLYWRKLTSEFIESPELGTINFHPAPLPEYKGTAGYNLAILGALDTWGVTAHYVDEEIDTGEIITVESFAMDPDFETAQSLEKKTIINLEALVYSICEKVAVRCTKLPATPNIGGRYVSREEMEAMKEIVAGDDVNRKIRAFWFPPYDGAYVK